MPAAAVLNFAKERKQQDLQEDLKPLPLPRGSTALEELTFCLEKLIKLVISISSKLSLDISIRHGWTGAKILATVVKSTKE